MRRFCQVIKVNGEHAVIVPSHFESVDGHCLETFEVEYDANQYAKKINALARVYRGGRAKDAKEIRSC